MAVTAIRLYNFMSFRDTGWLELRPLTLLFGKNSSGKSAIIRALLLLRQSLDAPPEDGPLIFAAEDGLNLGSFDRMIHGRTLYEDVEECEPRQGHLLCSNRQG
jgi:AAA15 family ATPase/GTPase